MPTIWEKVTENAKLISLPDVYLRLKSVIDDPDFAMSDIADVISQDPAMTARLLRLVNSAYFGFASKIDTVNRAVGMLGSQQVHDLVLAASVAQRFEGMSNQVMDMERFWLRSVTRAIACRELAVMCNMLDGERVFVAGLLSDIGHLIMYQSVPDAAQQALQQAEQQDAPLFKVERVMLGIDYAKVGGALMRQWNLPRSLWEPTEFHVEPGVALEFPMITSLVHIAVMIADGMESEAGFESVLKKVDQHAWQTTGLHLEQCIDMPERVGGQLNAVMNLIFPNQQKIYA
ncbi:MAG: HDOD domain-containing protein [Candidatus Thiodiazotropha sp. (ex Codakia rugifera)]|nr:HDOD domain-containing protein [Candidatus Thiodiazotropha sp. (ex Codakia rugifera)]